MRAERGERGSAHDTAQMDVYSDASDSIMDPMCILCEVRVRTGPRVCACGRLRAPGPASRWGVGTVVAVLVKYKLISHFCRARVVVLVVSTGVAQVVGRGGAALGLKSP